MKHRKLRIAWSVAWGIVAVLLVVLWVRSCWQFDVVMMTPYSIMVTSNRGLVAFALSGGNRKLIWSTVSIEDVYASLMARGKVLRVPPKNPFCFEIGPDYIRAHYVYPVILFGAVAALPWLRELLGRLASSDGLFELSRSASVMSDGVAT